MSADLRGSANGIGEILQICAELRRTADICAKRTRPVIRYCRCGQASGFKYAELLMSSLKLLRELRVTLVDELEACVNYLMEQMVLREVLTRDDREEILINPGPRKRVRKLLDIIDCKGEEVASTFLSIYSKLNEVKAKVVPEPSEQALSDDYSNLIHKHKRVLKLRNASMLYYNTRHGEKISFCEHFVNLLLVKGHSSIENKKHELLAFGQQRIHLQHRSKEQTMIKPAQLFSDTKAARCAKKILVTGVAGIGKTVLVQKILCDFGNNQGFSMFDFVIHLTFRDLNLISTPVSLRDLVLRKNGHLAKALDDIFLNDEKLLIILDGFDEFKYYKGCEVEQFITDHDQQGEVVEIFASIMLGELLPEASVLLTSRPTAISYIPTNCIDSFVVVTGFSVSEIKDFFLKYFLDEDLAVKMFDLVKANDLMLTLCYIPAFCYIVCSILKESKGPMTESPKTMTDIYVHYLVALMKSHTHSRTGYACNSSSENMKQLTETVVNLGHLAYIKFLQHETLFYGDTAEVQQVASSDLVSTFLDKTSVQEPYGSVDVYSFTHFTVQEFFAALYYVLAKKPHPDVCDSKVHCKQEMSAGYQDLFNRFLSGLLSERNQNLLSKHIQLRANDKSEWYVPWLLGEIQRLCESGAHILSHLHCFFEQQNISLAEKIQPELLRVNVSDDPLSPMDFSTMKYFLTLVSGNISELDLTATNITTESLRDLQPNLLRCEKLWLGENNLDAEAMHVLAEVLQSSDNLQYLGLGWTNIGDEEFSILSEGLRTNRSLLELWIEGNRVSYICLSAFIDLNPAISSLQKIVSSCGKIMNITLQMPCIMYSALWNDVSEPEAEKLKGNSAEELLVVTFTDDKIWQEWGEWVLHRCEVSSDEKLVNVLFKVCNAFICSLEIHWVQEWYTKLRHLIRTRINQCSEDEMQRKLEKFETMLNF
ncbi:NACHT, LRR and PYD domains-containing protein 3-like [Amia ocellicauda]|uniref:NACHT, LRR and PYD domains-containing protein 3-like n=1 Tax=Amia ocellicauda TaxID=2972642 RepID=UPI0034645D47